MSLILYWMFSRVGHIGRRIEEYHQALVEQDAILVSSLDNLKNNVEGEKP